MGKEKTFAVLANDIKDINVRAGNAAKGAVNQLMTLRNWAIGYYIVEYEQGGRDRAEYGSALLDNLEARINEKGMNKTLFKWCRQFYNMYPQIGATVSHQFGMLIDSQKGATVSNEFITNPELLVKRLSFSHIREIMVLEDEFERFFYETECIKCGWTVRELRRQIKTNLYFRSGVSKNPRELLKPSEDNPPVGILLCTDKGAQMVEYALSGMDNQLFVSTYMLHLPDKQKLEEFLRKELEEIE